MDQILGNWATWGWVALKAALLYITAVLAFRLGERRTLAEMSAFDFVAAVAVGAVVGRVPNSTTTSYVQGMITLIAVLAMHRIVSRMRQFPTLAHFFDHPPRILISKGQIVEPHLNQSGLTKQDLFGILRQHGILELEEVYLLVFEQRGQISIIRCSEIREREPTLVHDIVKANSQPLRTDR